MEKRITVVGGDLRNVKLVEMLADDGYEVNTYGLENAEFSNNIGLIKQYSNLKEAVSNSNIIIGPTPLSINNSEINMLFSSEKLQLEDFLSTITKGKILIAGSIKDSYFKSVENAEGKIIDLLKREELAVLNAISTSEGIISIAIHETVSTLHGSNVLVMGFGKVGKIISKMLDGFGANVYCEARKNVDLAWVKAYGYNPIHLNDIDKHLNKFDVIINTIPHVVLDEKRLDKVKKNCLIIDIASNPGGLDRNAAKRKGINFNWALSLPGKTAPVTSAEYMKETIYNILKEIKEL